jgi:glycosyltransferase involved in cell wall biosynthesis/peptidoglycan/xylan/chitin deacetylase (PgdA/CDA1 family)
LVELSVIIPTYNRAAMLRSCLEAFARQTQPTTDFEVIVVVDGSTDGTCAMLADFRAPFALRTYCQSNSGQSAALNRGAAEAQGRYCLFVDDDIAAEPDLVGAHLRAQRQHRGVVALGRLDTVLAPGADEFAHWVADELNDHYSRLDRGERSISWMDAYSGNISVPRTAFLEVGGFATDQPVTCDYELGYRLERHGLTIVYVPAAGGRQQYCKGFRQITAEAEKTGFASIELFRRHPPMLARLELGSFSGATWRQVLLRRLLLFLRIPVWPLRLVSVALGSRALGREWFRFVRSYCYWRGVRRAAPDRETWDGLTHDTPMLMYHAFGRPGEPAGRWIVPIRRFARQMGWLKRRGSRVLGLDEFVDCRREYRLPPARSVVVTIDDGYMDAFAAAKILQRYAFPATIFLVSGAVGGTNQWDRDGELTGRPLLSWSAIRELGRYGISYGAHSETHRSLRSLPPEQVEAEVARSRRDLERALGVPIHTFAYPYGEHDLDSQAAVERAGLLGACGVRRGLNSPVTPLYALHRTEIRGTDSLAHFVLALWTGDADALSHGWPG